MKSVIIKYPGSVNLVAQMSQMRWWLDARKYVPCRFQYHFGGQVLFVEVEFDEDSKAEEFLHAFDSVESEFLT